MNILKNVTSALAGAILMTIAIGTLSVPQPAFANAAQIAPDERNRQIVTEAFDRWQAGTGNFFNDVLSSDVVWTIEGSGPYAGTLRGQKELVDRAVRPLTARLASPVRPVSKTVWADGEHVIIRWHGETTAADGRPYTNTYAWILRMEDGKVVEVNAFLDLARYEDVFRRIPNPVTR